METRKKSINLASLGLIKVSNRNGSSSLHRSSSSKSASTADPRPSHPPKRIKRSHTLAGTSPTSPPNAISKSHDRRKSQPPIHALPLTPQPDDLQGDCIDKASIDDEVVLGVINQLERTGNRPVHIKELCVILANIDAVNASANPAAIIASRLSSFLKRTQWAETPCPLAKELTTTQPRRIYFYLATRAHQPLPTQADNPILDSMRIISPSISSGPDDQDQGDKAPEAERGDSRREPEMHSPSPGLEDPDYYSGHHTHSLSFSEPLEHQDLYGSAYQQAASPPLEHEEREFEQTVSDMATRKASEQAATPGSNPDPSYMQTADQNAPAGFFDLEDAVVTAQAVGGQEEESEETRQKKNHEAASSLFGLSVDTGSHLGLTSSPIMPPSTAAKNIPPATSRLCFGGNDDDSAWNDLKSPDCVDMSELDDLLSGG